MSPQDTITLSVRFMLKLELNITNTTESILSVETSVVTAPQSPFISALSVFMVKYCILQDDLSELTFQVREPAAPLH